MKIVENISLPSPTTVFLLPPEPLPRRQTWHMATDAPISRTLDDDQWRGTLDDDEEKEKEDDEETEEDGD